MTWGGIVRVRRSPARAARHRAVASAGEQPVAVDAAPSPSSQGGVSGSSASRSPARNMGAPPGILAAASPVPVKTRVRADALKAPKPAGSVPQGPAGAEARGQGPKAPRGRPGPAQRSLSGTHPSHPILVRTPAGREHGPRPPAPLRGSRTLSRSSPRADKAARIKPRGLRARARIATTGLPPRHDRRPRRSRRRRPGPARRRPRKGASRASQARSCVTKAASGRGAGRPASAGPAAQTSAREAAASAGVSSRIGGRPVGCHATPRRKFPARPAVRFTPP